MRLWRKRFVFGIISFFILCSLLFHPAISKTNIGIDEMDNYKFKDLINKNRIFEKQNLEYIENIDCSCDQIKEKAWYPKILCSFLFMKIGILNIRIFYLEIVYLIIRLKVILNKIMDLLDTKSRFIDLMEVFNCPRIPSY